MRHRWQIIHPLAMPDAFCEVRMRQPGHSKESTIDLTTLYEFLRLLGGHATNEERLGIIDEFSVCR